MKPITYRNLDEKTRGIHDEYSIQELVGKDLCRQIFEKYHYKYYKPLNFETDSLVSELFDYDTDYGIDDVIYLDEIPKDDPLNFKQFYPSKWDDLTYTIDYKSNNNMHMNSVYVKLMKYRGSRAYLPFYENNGKTIYPIYKNMKIDRRRWERANKKGKDTINSQIEHYYRNKWLLSDDNRTEYVFYVNYTKPEDGVNKLNVAHLVPAEELRNQVVSLLNAILKKGGYKQFIELKPDFYLNHKIMKAYQICKGEKRDSHKMELFKLPRGDISLRIPDHLLIPHIKFNKYGNIITSS